MSAIRVVVAFGAENLEINNYTKYLERAIKAGLKSHSIGAISIGLLLFVIYSSYAYAFYIASLFC